MEHRHITDQQQVLADLAREGSTNRRETSAVIAPGAGAAPLAVTIKSHVAYNTYLVGAVTLEDMGAVPREIGEPMEAVNLAESFLTQGTLAPGAYAILYHLGEKNIFYAVP